MSRYDELQKAAAYAAQDTIKFADEDEEMRALQQFHEEVDPETVLALIAENDLLRGAHEQICTSYNQVSYASEERGKQIDQLKAELEHTGYDHDLLRNENDQLKAENEALRDHLRLRVSAMPRDRLRETFNAAYYGPRELGSDGEQCRAGVLAVIDAAMGKGEKS